nr:hypothetical protein [Deltaproteobacteria bacterium]
MTLGTSTCPARTCTTILRAGRSVGTGYYWIDPDGAGGQAASEVWCDMSTADGGWTLVGRSRPGGWAPGVQVPTAEATLVGVRRRAQCGMTASPTPTTRPVVGCASASCSSGITARVRLGGAMCIAVRFPSTSSPTLPTRRARSI